MFYGNTHVGNIRRVNEDSFQILQTENFAILADGMGGMGQGDVASSKAVEYFVDIVKQQLEKKFTPTYFTDSSYKTIQNDLAVLYKTSEDEVNEKLLKLVKHEKQGSLDMGTTLVTAFVTDNYISISNIGDSRCYLMSEDKLDLVTEDHNCAWECMLKESPEYIEEIYVQQPYSNILTKYIGPNSEGSGIDAFLMKRKEKDRLLLCSDGLQELRDGEISKILLEFKGQEAVDKLIEEALKTRAKDNITVILFEP
jgi:protein phosphatase